MKTSPQGQIMMQGFEDCKLISYADPKTHGAPYTIGWGHTGPGIDRAGIVWTQAMCDEQFLRDLEPVEAIVTREVHVPLTQGQFDALVSIVYNVGPGSTAKDGIVRLRSGGPSTLLRKLNVGDYDGAVAEFAKWVSPGSDVEKGLKRRRAVETVRWHS